MQLSTPGGYSLLDVVSALIKSMRYGREEEALFWAWELIEHHNYLWKRLLIFSIQDVGLADPSANVRIKTLSDTFYALRGSQNDASEFTIIQAVLYLCRAEKSTEIDVTRTTIIEKRLMGERMSIPEDAEDVHTKSFEPGHGEVLYYRKLLDDEKTTLGFIHGAAGKPGGYIKALPAFRRDEIKEKMKEL